jgi:hypothetical protein
MGKEENEKSEWDVAEVSSNHCPISHVVGTKICTSVNFSCLPRRRWENHSNEVCDNVLNFLILSQERISMHHDNYERVTFQNKI